MSKSKMMLLGLGLVAGLGARSQVMTLEQIVDSVTASHPVVKMYDHEIRSMDEAARGARSWMPTDISTGLWMVPYNPNMWKPGDMGEPGMGQYMIGAQQMFPNRKKLDADEAYMKAMSSVEKQKKGATLNELIHDAKQFYYEWLVLKKKLVILDQNEKLLDFMIRNAEIRYKNGMDKINAYYKAKAALGNVQNMRMMYETDIRERRIRLNSLMNRYAMLDFDIDTTYVLQDFSSMAFDSTLFYQQRSDLKAIDENIQLMWLKQETERQSLKPQFGVRYEHMFGFGDLPMQYSLMGMMRVPIGRAATRMNKANIESLKWKSRALEAQKEMMVNEYSGMAYGMRTELDLKKRQIQLYEATIIPSLRNNYKTMQLGYEQNTEELFMLFDAWEALYMTQLEYTELLNEALKLQVTIERLIEKK